MLKIQSVADLQVGDVGFGVIPGRVGGIVSFGQWLIDAANLAHGRTTEQAWFTHTWIVAAMSDAGNGRSVMIVEAMPRGARSMWLKGQDRIGPGNGWARLDAIGPERWPLTALAIGKAAREYIGTPYSFLDYLSLALLHLGLPRRLTARRVTDSGHMICSQLVDTVLTRAGVHLFDDGRLPQDVTPGALFRRCGALGEVCWW
jgi:hypothetical protein